MKKTVETVTTVTVIKDVICDKCGKSAQMLSPAFNEKENDSNMTPVGLCYAELEYRPGFGSKFDGDRWCADLCEDCWLDVMEYITKLRPDNYTAEQPCLIRAENFWCSD